MTQAETAVIRDIMNEELEVIDRTVTIMAAAIRRIASSLTWRAPAA